MAKKATGTKATAWTAFQHFIRVRDCLATTGFPFVGICITCGRRNHISNLQAGHCFGGRKNGHLFHEKFVNAQCTRCNELFHGQTKKYRAAMDKKYTKTKVDEWKIEADKVIHDRDMDFKAITTEYREKLNTLLAASNTGYYTYEDILAGKSF
ncbi:recombination protein NinG [Candidatus Pacearchaeota archaeon]|nr:recombination protein NinG [Candidatus Pacearchaeota archaeon]